MCIRSGKGSRPRTKDRPSHADAQWGMVATKDRGRWGVVLDNTPDIVVTCMRVCELGRTNIVVSNRVGVVDDVSGHGGTLVYIAKLAERSTVLHRTTDDNDLYERIIVTSAGLLLIVYAVADPEPHTGFVERILAAAYADDARPILCLTKSDLADPQEFAGEFPALGVGVVVCGINDDLTPPLELTGVPGRMIASVGYSGVGKSTLVDRTASEVNRETGEVNGMGKRRHTSTQLVTLMLPSESVGDATSWIIDIPGIRSFGLVHVTPGALLATFPGIQATIDECSCGCTYLGPPADPECAFDKLEGVQHRRAVAMHYLFSAIGDNEDWEPDIERD